MFCSGPLPVAMLVTEGRAAAGAMVSEWTTLLPVARVLIHPELQPARDHVWVHDPTALPPGAMLLSEGYLAALVMLI